jgi:rhodanese-related sulfurtransferase
MAKMKDIFNRCCLKIDGIAYPLPAEVKDLLEQGAVLVDLREELETEIRAFGVEGVIYLPHAEFDDKWMTLPLDSPLILADAVGIWSKKYAVLLRSKGYGHVASLAGGIADWEKDGYPMKAGKYQPLNGVCACMIKPRERKQP